MRVKVTHGMAHDLYMSKLLKDNGVHVTKVHNRTILYHEKIGGWLAEALVEATKQGLEQFMEVYVASLDQTGLLTMKSKIDERLASLETAEASEKKRKPSKKDTSAET